MKTILAIEHDISELETIMDGCRQGQNEFTIFSAQNLPQAQTILTRDRVDLIVCSTVFPATEEFSVIAELAKEFPFIPLVAISSEPTSETEKARHYGARAVAGQPLDRRSLIEQVDELVERSSTGTVKGIPISSFLQMLENDGDSCTLCVTCAESTGYLFLRSDFSMVNEMTISRNR